MSSRSQKSACTGEDSKSARSDEDAGTAAVLEAAISAIARGVGVHSVGSTGSAQGSARSHRSWHAAEDSCSESGSAGKGSATNEVVEKTIATLRHMLEEHGSQCSQQDTSDAAPSGLLVIGDIARDVAMKQVCNASDQGPDSARSGQSFFDEAMSEAAQIAADHEATQQAMESLRLMVVDASGPLAQALSAEPRSARTPSNCSSSGYNHRAGSQGEAWTNAAAAAKHIMGMPPLPPPSREPSDYGMSTHRSNRSSVSAADNAMRDILERISHREQASQLGRQDS